jgi:hypothetical protein
MKNNTFRIIFTILVMGISVGTSVLTSNWSWMWLLALLLLVF